MPEDTELFGCMIETYLREGCFPITFEYNHGGIYYITPEDEKLCLELMEENLNGQRDYTS